MTEDVATPLTLYKNLEKITKVDKWAPLVLESLRKKLGNPDEFIDLIKETGAILSGGFVLQAITDYPDVTDLDIYVPVDKMPEFLNRLVVDQMFIFDSYKHYNATIYCRSFLRKNGIKRVHTFRGHVEYKIDDKIEHNDLMIDIMSVRKKNTIQAVCSNFDLTYCQVWFDGTDVFATHPEHITKKEGYLQGDYINVFLKGNNFLKGRLRKYKKRGFKTSYEPSTDNLPSIDFVTSDRCTKQRFDEILPLWFKKVITKWLTIDDVSAFYVPLGNHMNYMPGSDELVSSEGITFKKIGFAIDNENEFEVSYDEGYDSEDMDTDKLIELANRKEEKEEEEEKEAPEEEEEKEEKEEPELKYRRSMFDLLQHLFTNTGDNFFYNFYHLMYDEETKKDNPEKYEPYANYLRDNCTRKGEDMFGDEGHLYDFHLHPLEGGITRESLEGYLQPFLCLSEKDKLKGVACYYKPYCKIKINLKEIQSIVSNDFYEKFMKSQPVKLGLNTVMPVYEAALMNEKTEEKGYGKEFHETMCPFCLVPVSRGSGCSYMTHENPNQLDKSEAPYCDDTIVNKRLLDKYKRMAPKIDPSYKDGTLIKIEFCVECGRPCLKHQHFDITSDTPRLVPPKMTPNPINPTHMVHDYATCAGGGRVELVARMLAVRDVYKFSLIKDPIKERNKAAFAADKAATMKCYLDRATAILQLKDRKFNTNVKKSKKYNYPGYEYVIEDESLPGSSNNEAKVAYQEVEKINNSNNESNESNESNDDQILGQNVPHDIFQIDEGNNEGNEGNQEGGRETKNTYRRYIRKVKHKTYKLRKKK